MRTDSTSRTIFSSIAKTHCNDICSKSINICNTIINSGNHRAAWTTSCRTSIITHFNCNQFSTRCNSFDISISCNNACHMSPMSLIIHRIIIIVYEIPSTLYFTTISKTTAQSRMSIINARINHTNCLPNARSIYRTGLYCPDIVGMYQRNAFGKTCM